MRTLTRTGLDRVEAWMDDHDLPPGPIEDVHPVGGGTQNVMLTLRRGGREYVLRRGPAHLRGSSNAALAREVEVLRALRDTGVPHPRLVAACLDAEVLDGAVFYLMEPVAGFNAAERLPARHAASMTVRRDMGFAVVDALAALHAVDHVRVGLGGLGRPDGFLERQVPRWLGQLESYTEFPGYGRPRLAGVEAVAGWLEAHRPARWSPRIVHGDAHLANVMFAFDGPAVAALVDWEMTTIGPPLLDLGWLLATWPEAGDRVDGIGGALGIAGGLPTAAELVARYPHDVRDVDFYVVLAAFKLGIVLEGTHARACASQAPQATGARLHAIATDLILRARRIIDQGVAQ